MTYAENILRIPNGAVLETVHALRVRLKQSTWEDLEAQYPLDQFLSDLRGIEMGLFILGAETVDGGSRLVSELTDFFGELRGGDRWFGLCPGREPNDLGAAETLLSTCGLPDSLHPLAEESCEWRPRNKQNRWDGYDLVCLLGGPVELPGLNAANATLQIGGSMPRQINAVYLPAGRVGVTVPGTCLRFDGVPVHLGQLSVNQLPAITDLLERLMINR